jgi:hypothetical protein
MTLTGKGMAVGSPRYMSPEQARAKPVTAQTDLYLMGLIFYELLTGRPLFERKSPTDYLLAHIREEPDHPSVDGVALAGPMVDLLMQCLAKKQEDRPESAESLLQQLEACRGYGLDELGTVTGAFPADPDGHSTLLPDDFQPQLPDMAAADLLLPPTQPPIPPAPPAPAPPPAAPVKAGTLRLPSYADLKPPPPTPTGLKLPPASARKPPPPPPPRRPTNAGMMPRPLTRDRLPVPPPMVGRGVGAPESGPPPVVVIAAVLALLALIVAGTVTYRLLVSDDSPPPSTTEVTGAEDDGAHPQGTIASPEDEATTDEPDDAEASEEDKANAVAGAKPCTSPRDCDGDEMCIDGACE